MDNIERYKEIIKEQQEKIDRLEKDTAAES